MSVTPSETFVTNSSTGTLSTRVGTGDPSKPPNALLHILIATTVHLLSLQVNTHPQKNKNMKILINPGFIPFRTGSKWARWCVLKTLKTHITRRVCLFSTRRPIHSRCFSRFHPSTGKSQNAECDDYDETVFQVSAQLTE